MSGPDAGPPPNGGQERPKPLLFAVFNAITGSKATPAGHNMPRDCRHVLQHMANRADNDSHLYDFAAATVEADADLCAAVVRRCIAELVRRGWLVFHGWSGPRNNAHRVYQVRAEGSGWEKSKAMAREAPPQRRARLAPTPRVTPETAPTPDVTAGCDAVLPRGDTGCQSGVTPDVSLPPDLPPLLPLREPPITPAQARVNPSQQQVPLLDLCAVPPPKAGAAKPPRAPKEPLAEDRYAAAYIAGHAAAGGVLADLDKHGKGYIGRAAKAHARYRDGAAITGNDLVAWIQKRAEAFRRHVGDPQFHTGGYSPRGFLFWLDNGHDGAKSPLRAGEAEPTEAPAWVAPRPTLPPSTPEESRQNLIDLAARQPHLRERIEGILANG